MSIERERPAGGSVQSAQCGDVAGAAKAPMSLLYTPALPIPIDSTRQRPPGV